jgi:RNase P subunit RPR2
MKMMLKGCRRCKGDLMPDGTDRDGLTMTCLQCGLEVRFRAVTKAVAVTRVERPIAA